MPDRSTKLTVDIVGDASKGVRALREYEIAAKSAGNTTAAMATKIRSDLEKVEQAARDAAAANQKLAAVGSSSSGLNVGGAAKTVAGQGLESAISSRSAVAGNVVSQLGGGEQLLGNVASKAAVATAAIALTAAAATKFGVDSVQAFSHSAEAVDKFQDVAGTSAEESSKLVGAAQALGVSSDTLANAMGKLARNAATNETTLNKYGAAVVRTASGSVDLEATLQSVASAYARTEDPSKRAVLANAAFGRSWQELTDVLERGGTQLNTALADAAKHAPIFSQDDLGKAKDFQIAVENLKQELTKLEVSIGGQLVGDLTTLADTATSAANAMGGDDGLAGALKKVATNANPIHVVAEALQGIETAGHAVAGVVGNVGDSTNAATTEVHGMGEAARDGFAVLHGGAQVGVQDLQAVGDQASITAGKLTTVAASFASAIAAFQSQNTATSAVITSTTGWADSLDSANSLLTAGADDARKYAEAQDRGARQIADAQKSVSDAISGAADAQDAYGKAVDDANRSVADAQAAYARTVEQGQRRIADVEEQSAKRIVDAQDKVTQARRRAEEQAVNSARRIEDATQALRDAETDALRDDNPYQAARRRAEAEQGLSRAKEDAARDQQDSADNVASAEKDLADAQVQAAKDRADAERDAAEAAAQAQQRIADANRQAADQIASAQKRVEDANGRVDEANGRLEQTTGDVARSLDDAARSAAGHSASLQDAERSAQGVVDASPGFVLAMMQRGASLGEINTQVDLGKQKIQELGAAFGIPQPIIDALIGQLDHVVGDMLAIRDLTPAAYDFAAAMKLAGQNFSDPSTRAMFDSGALEVVGTGQAVPKFAGGGVFHAPRSGGAGLAVLHDNEAVFTPEQQAALRGAGPAAVEVHFHGPIWDRNGLAGALAELKRLGY